MVKILPLFIHCLIKFATAKVSKISNNYVYAASYIKFEKATLLSGIFLFSTSRFRVQVKKNLSEDTGPLLLLLIGIFN